MNMVSFKEFWDAYPAKKGKAMAEKAWAKVLPIEQADVLAALKEQAASDRKFKQFTPNASTWLNQRRWEDEIDSTQPAPAGRYDRSHFSPNQHDGQCSFTHNGAQCPLPGNHCNGVSTAPGPWWCLWHRHELNRGHGPEQDEFFRLYGPRENAQEQVEISYEDPLREALKQTLADNPEWRRLPSEAQSAYHARMRAAARGLLNRVRDSQQLHNDT